MLDFGWTHILILLVVALVVVGPKDLPKVMRTLGQWAGRARAMADQFRRSFEDMARQSELDELRHEVTRLKHEATKPMTDLDYQAFGIDPKDLPTLEDVDAKPAPAPQVTADASGAPPKEAGAADQGATEHAAAQTEAPATATPS
jgi:sec-independent protein translocase protein TatB